MSKVLQINLAGSCGTQILALQWARKLKIDIIVASEFYKYGQCTNVANGWYCDKNRNTAIFNCEDTPIDAIGNAENTFFWVKIGNLRIYLCYWSPNTTTVDHENWL